MSGTTSGAQCTRKTNSPDGLCPQHRDARLPLKALNKKYLKMPPPKVIAPVVPDSAENHAAKMLPIAKETLMKNFNASNYVGTAIGILAVGAVSGQAYYEASQKMGWTWTKTNRHLRFLNALVPEVLDEGGFTLNKTFIPEINKNLAEASKDTSYLTYPVADRETIITLALQRTGMEEDSRNAKESGNPKAASIYKEFSKLLIELAYEEDPASAAENIADDLENTELPTRGGIVFGKFNIPKYQGAVTGEQREARRNVIARYREIAATLRGENKAYELPSGNQADLDVTRSQTSSGTYYRVS